MKIEFAVQMTCQSCVEKVKKSLSELTDISNVDINLSTGSVIVESSLPQNVIKHQLESTGMKTVLKGYGQLGSAVAMLAGNTGYSHGNIKGVIRFVQEDIDTCVIDGTIENNNIPLKINIYECGDISDNCTNLGNKLYKIFDQTVQNNGKQHYSNNINEKNSKDKTIEDDKIDLRKIKKTNEEHNMDNSETKSNLLETNGIFDQIKNNIGIMNYNNKSTTENSENHSRNGTYDRNIETDKLCTNNTEIINHNTNLTENNKYQTNHTRKNINHDANITESTPHPTSTNNENADHHTRAAAFSVSDNNQLVLKLSNKFSIASIIGRSVVIEDSKSNKLACAVIARSAGIEQNRKIICACDGVTIWEEKIGK